LKPVLKTLPSILSSHICVSLFEVCVDVGVEAVKRR